MNCVSLIFTVHEGLGLANVSELHAILLRARPEVIFLEVPPAAFSDFYLTGRRQNLESNAVKRYLEDHPLVRLIPVDLPTPAREFFEDHAYLCTRVRETSREYRQLLHLDGERLKAYGFAYLNSEYCSIHWSNVYAEILRTVERLAEPGLAKIYLSWEKTNECREREMMAAIQKYCVANTFERGVFLVGAAHRQRIIDMSSEQSVFDWSLLQVSGDA